MSRTTRLKVYKLAVCPVIVAGVFSIKRGISSEASCCEKAATALEHYVPALKTAADSEP